jgi:uncharacterized protein
VTFKDKYGPVGLIAGASEGLGAAYCHALAKRGLDLVLIARRKEALGAIADEIASTYGVKVQALACDLAAADASERIFQEAGHQAIHCVIYNAAASFISPFLDLPLSSHHQMLSVNVHGPLNLVHAFAPRMIQDKRGALVLMSSLAGFQGSGYLSTYAATKAFNRILAESLWYEWKSKGVDAIACCAGATATPNYYRSGPGRTSFFAPQPQRPEQVVEECLQKIGKTASFIPGASNKIASFLMQHVFSRKKAIHLMGDTTKKMYGIAD